MTRLLSPGTVAEATALLAAWPDARCIAGGATLVAMLNAGLIDAPVLVNLRSIGGLAGIERLGDGSLRIGALTLHAETAASPLFTGGQTMIPAAAAVIANPVVRNMGTMGGSVAFADPAADYPPALAACDATIEIAGPNGARELPVGQFFLDWYSTALDPGEIVTAIRVPAAPPNTVGAYRKLSRTHGDYAIASVALALGLRDGITTHIACAIGGCGPTPMRLPTLEAALIGQSLTPALLHEFGATLAEACDPVDDTRASAAYRRLVVPRLLASTFAEARLAASA